MIIRLSIVFLICSVTSNLRGQDKRLAEDTAFLYSQLDSLRYVSTKTPDSTTLKSYFDLSLILARINSNQALEVGFEVLALAKKLQADESIAQAHNRLAYYYINSTQFDKAIEHLYQSRKILKASDNYWLKSKLELLQGIFENDQGRYQKAIRSYHLSLSYSQRITDKQNIGICFNNIGVSFLKWKDV